MTKSLSKIDKLGEESTAPSYVPSNEEMQAVNRVMKDVITGRNIINKSYNQFNGRNLFDALDDWTKRWNGYIPQPFVMDDIGETQLFLNFTRNTVISYLSKIALQRPDVKITAVNKRTGVDDRKFAEVLRDLNRYSLDAENGDARFLEATFEVLTKGTVIVYEGYAKNHQKTKVPSNFDAETGKVTYKEEDRIIFDNCFQRVVPLEDFYISNPYQTDVQKQPFIIWRELTTKSEADADYSHYPNYKYVKAGNYTLTAEPTTFYRNRLYTELSPDQVEILRYYKKSTNEHIVLINGIVIYEGPIPFKDGNYPFAKTIFEPFDNNFFWGAGLANKIMGEQDLLNTFWNMMVDKTKGSLLPYGLSSDLDDIIEDDVLRTNKIRKVSDINKWKFDTLPGVTQGEQQMLQTTLNFAREFSGDIGGASTAYTPQGGKVTARQALLKQQEAQKRLSYSLYFLEDLERDRTLLRINHILQFYSIPKIEHITGKKGKEIEKMAYREIKLSNTKLSDGRVGNRIVKLIDSESTKNPDQMEGLRNELSVTEAMGEETGIATEALAINVDTFYDYNFEILVVKNSSFERNQILDQAQRKEYADWRMSLAQVVPVDAIELINWVNESYDIETDRFTPKQSAQSGPLQPGQQAPGANVTMPPMQPSGKSGESAGPAQKMAGNTMPNMANMM